MRKQRNLTMKLTEPWRIQGKPKRRKKVATRQKLKNTFKTGWLTIGKASTLLNIKPKSVMRRVQRGTMKRKTLKDGTKLFYVTSTMVRKTA